MWHLDLENKNLIKIISNSLFTEYSNVYKFLQTTENLQMNTFFRFFYTQFAFYYCFIYLFLLFFIISFYISIFSFSLHLLTF